MRIAALLVLLISLPALAQVGFYKSSEPPGVARQWSEMCIEQSSGQSFTVTFHGGYCPTTGNDCSNARFDDLTFEAISIKGALLYKHENCTLRIVVGKSGGAKVSQRGHCSSFDLFPGRYEKRASEVWQDDCSPIGGPDTHHE